MMTPPAPTAYTLDAEEPHTPTRSTGTGVGIFSQLAPPVVERRTVPNCPTAKEVWASTVQMPSIETSVSDSREIRHDATGTDFGTTVTRVWPVERGLVARIWAWPGATAVTIPSGPTRATPGLLLTHSTV